LTITMKRIGGPSSGGSGRGPVGRLSTVPH
jgi:hypothetical protein